MQQFLKPLPIFGGIDHVRTGPNDWYAVSFQIQRQFQRCLATVLHDDPKRLFLVDDFQHVLKGQRFKIQAVAGVVIG